MADAAQNYARLVLDEADIARALTRIAHQILERNKGSRDVVLLGIQTRGVELARRLGERIAAVEPPGAPVGALDVTMYRDDVRIRPARALSRTEIPAEGVDDKVVVLVDDVLFSGRTIRAALTALDDLGRPRSVQLGVLVDRGHRELPIRADFVGKNLPTATDERVTVLLSERDGRDAVLIEKGYQRSHHATEPPRASTGGEIGGEVGGGGSRAAGSGNPAPGERGSPEERTETGAERR